LPRRALRGVLCRRRQHDARHNPGRNVPAVILGEWLAGRLSVKAIRVTAAIGSAALGGLTLTGIPTLILPERSQFQGLWRPLDFAAHLPVARRRVQKGLGFLNPESASLLPNMLKKAIIPPAITRNRGNVGSLKSFPAEIVLGRYRGTLMYRLFIGAFFAAVLCLSHSQNVYAHDTSGIHAFVNDDRNQFADLWLNNDGNVTVKASNGRQWRPMWIVVHADFWSGKQLLARNDYHVYCQSPFPGGHGQETWFRFAGPGVSGVTSISLSSNNESPWTHPQGGWSVMLSVSRPAPCALAYSFFHYDMSREIRLRLTARCCFQGVSTSNFDASPWHRVTGRQSPLY
jgi:hypothetical protein